MNSNISFVDRAVDEVDGLHRVLQGWFRAEGNADTASVLAHFDAAFRMITPAGKVLTYEQLAGALPGMRGSRPGLVMEISDIVVCHHDGDAVLLTYHERQQQADVTTNRISTVLMIDRPDRPTPVWRHLQETLLS